jgi:hypothetical protein
MSVGNLKDSGNQGNNLPWQWKVLQGLQGIITQLQTTLSADVNIVGPLGQQDCDDSVAVTLCKEQAKVPITPVLLASANSTGNLTAYSGQLILSISFANDGTADADISVDAEATYIKLAPGMTINLDANGVMNYYDPSFFYWKTNVTPGASLLIAFNYI